LPREKEGGRWKDGLMEWWNNGKMVKPF